MSMSSRASLWFGAPVEEQVCPPQQPPVPVNQPKPVQAASIQIHPEMEQTVYERYFQQVTRRDFHQTPLLLQYARERQTTPHMLWLSFMLHIQNNNLDNTLANLIEYLSVTAKNDGKAVNYVYVNNSITSGNQLYGTVNNCGVHNFDHGIGKSCGVISNQGFDGVANSNHGFDIDSNSHHGYDINNTSGGTHQSYDMINGFDMQNNHVFGIANHGSVNNIVKAQNVNLGSANSSLTSYQNLSVNDNFNNSYEESKVEHRPFVRPPPYTYVDFLRVKREAEEVFEERLEEEERRRAEDEKKKEVLRNIQDMLK